jgi:hypothetical protein
VHLSLRERQQCSHDVGWRCSSLKQLQHCVSEASVPASHVQPLRPQPAWKAAVATGGTVTTVSATASSRAASAIAACMNKTAVWQPMYVDQFQTCCC